jgi:prepilin-type N-terminal cleavage/methylation domain-containing protein
MTTNGTDRGTQQGFTLIELLVTMAVLGIMGVALARLMLYDSRFVAKQEAILEARQAARAAVTLLQTELHLASDGSVMSASDTSIKLRLPYAFGVLCGYAADQTIASLMPVDSVQYATASADGVAWRTSAGTYTHQSPVSVAASSDMASCNADSVRLVPGGSLITIGSTFIANPGTIIYLYQRVEYWFGPSGNMPGRIGLFRKAGSAAAEELLVPFSSDAGFDYVVGSDLTIQDLPPAVLDSIQGLVLRIPAESYETPQGADGPEEFELSLQVKFLNRAM